MPSDERDNLLRSILSSLDIPRLTCFPSKYDKSILGPYDPDYFDRYVEIRKSAEVSAQNALEEMSDLQLLRLNDDYDLFREFERKHDLFDMPEWYAAGFGARPAKDFDYWVKMPTWTSYEATCLSIGFSPDEPKVPPDNGSGASLPPGPKAYFHKRHRLICRAFQKVDDEDASIAPVEFLAWIEKSNFEVPEALLSALEDMKHPRKPAMLKNVDARTHESLQKVMLAIAQKSLGDLSARNTNELETDVRLGLEELNLALDPKTIKSVVKEALKKLPKFQEAQRIRNEKGA